MTSFPHLPIRILKFYTEVLTGFSHVPSPNSLNTTFLSQGCIPGVASGSGEGKWNAHSKPWGGDGSTLAISAWSPPPSQEGVGFWSGVPHPSSISCLTALPPPGNTYSTLELVKFLKLLDFKLNLFFSRKTQKYRRRHTGSERKEHKFGARK